jgi:tetratricopeptide (TPR) repeat protein
MDLFTQAMKMEGTPATAPFEYAMLLRERGGNREEVKRYLRLAVELNPKLAEAQYLLGMMAAAEERHGEAIFHLEQALGVLPRQSLFWQGLAASYLANGEKEKARLAAGRAVEAAVSNEERNMAAGVLRQIDGGAPRLRAREPASAASQGEASSPATERISGVLERIDCLGSDARFHVRSEGRLRTYWVEKPGEVLLKHASSLTFTFRCGVQAPAVPVVIEYRAKPDVNRMTSGVVVGVEFR